MLIGFDMLSCLGFLMVITFMTLIMTRRLTPMIALILIPTIFAIVGGFGGSMGPMMLDGVKNLAPTGVMLMFAILYFGIMNDAGLFDPLIRITLRLAQGDPLKVLVGTAILTLLVSLDGDGTTTYIIVLTALLPLYQRLKLNPLFLSGVVMLAVGITNIVPWGGPTARAASALHLDPNELFTPMLPAMAGSACWVILVAYILGLCERKRLGKFPDSITEAIDDPASTAHQHPKKMIFNALLTLALVIMLIQGSLPLSVLFILALALALLVNYPSPEAQKERMAAYAPSILMVVSLIFSAGIFTGILSGTHMVDAMTNCILALVSKETGPHLSVITALVSLPLTFFVSNETFYYGMLPILTQAAEAYGISAAEMGRAAIVGQPVHVLSPLVPSTYLLVSMAKVDFGDHQRFTILWAIVSCLVMLAIGLLVGVIPV
jgi:CitMHS family citrate-Mg2+:H+ or citrate-Ca2+:H+ symporter